jgi:hypothetical protein
MAGAEWVNDRADERENTAATKTAEGKSHRDMMSTLAGGARSPPPTGSPTDRSRGAIASGLTGHPLRVCGCRKSASWTCPSRGPLLDQRLRTFRRGAPLSGNRRSRQERR